MPQFAKPEEKPQVHKLEGERTEVARHFLSPAEPCWGIWRTVGIRRIGIIATVEELIK